MSKKKREPSEFLKELITLLMDSCEVITYIFLSNDLGISKSDVSAVKKGEDKKVHFYQETIHSMLEMNNITIDDKDLLELIRAAVAGHRDIVIGTVPRGHCETEVPKKWVTIAKWGSRYTE